MRISTHALSVAMSNHTRSRSESSHPTSQATVKSEFLRKGTFEMIRGTQCPMLDSLQIGGFQNTRVPLCARLNGAQAAIASQTMLFSGIATACHMKIEVAKLINEYNALRLKGLEIGYTFLDCQNNGIDVRLESKVEMVTGSNDLRPIAKNALLQILIPLTGFVSDAGMSVGELYSIVCEAAVRSAAAKQLETSNRLNISGIAATTGIQRAEISRILKRKTEPWSDQRQQSTNRIVAAWQRDPSFIDKDGNPRELTMYGRGSTFERLAKKYGRGIPARALLDELIRSGTVEIVDQQKLRVTAGASADRGMSGRAINAFGERASELLATMLMNMRKPEVPRFIATVSEATFSLDLLPVFRKDLSVRGTSFLGDVQEMLERKPPKIRSKRRKPGVGRISVSVFCCEAFDQVVAKENMIKRRNFHRE
jgi:hypothetical protein